MGGTRRAPPTARPAFDEERRAEADDDAEGIELRNRHRHKTATCSRSTDAVAQMHGGFYSILRLRSESLP